jgi:putative ABC transport system permease protein
MTLGHDLRLALRSLWRHPALAIFASLTLALGVGINAAIFSVANTVLLRPLPLPHPEQLVILVENAPALGMLEMGGTPLNFLDWQHQNHALQSLCAYRPLSYALGGHGGEPEPVGGAAVTGDFFRTMGVQPLLGRFLGPADDRPGAARVAVLGAELWHRRYGGQPSILGQTVGIDGQPFVVVGIAPATLAYPGKSQLWVPLALDYAKERRGAHYLGVLGRLRRG